MSNKFTTHPSVRFWNKQARKYAKSKVSDMKGYERSIDRTQDFLTPEMRVLEVGCGTGTTALRHALKCKKFIGTDIASEMIKIAEKKAVEAKIGNIGFIEAKADKMPFDSKSFDVVMGHNIYHLVDDVDLALVEARRVLKKEGVFITKTPCLGEMNVLMRKLVLPIMLRLYGMKLVHMFRKDDFLTQLKNAGFKVESVEDHGVKDKSIRPFIVAVAV